MAREYFIRKAERWDIPALETLLRRGIEESNGLLPEHDPAHVWHTSVTQVEMGLLLLACMKEDDKREMIVGCLSLDVQSWHWNPGVKICRTVHYYVIKDHRTAKVGDMLIGKALLEAGKQTAFAISLHYSMQAGRWIPVPLLAEVLFQLGDGAQIAAKDAWMEKNGFMHCGSNHIWVPAEPEELKQAADKAA